MLQYQRCVNMHMDLADDLFDQAVAMRRRLHVAADGTRSARHLTAATAAVAGAEEWAKWGGCPAARLVRGSAVEAGGGGADDGADDADGAGGVASGWLAMLRSAHVRAFDTRREQGD